MMPKLPVPVGLIAFDGDEWEPAWISQQDAFNEEQLIEYGRAVAEACIAICKKEAELCDEDVPLDSFISACAEELLRGENGDNPEKLIVKAKKLLGRE